MEITYISHSGFAVELKTHVLLFDYYKGEIPKFDVDKHMIVFASHVHHDHYVKEIFELKEQYANVHYVLSSDIRKSAKKILAERQMEESVTFLRMHQELKLGEVNMQTLKSTDAGVAFLVSCEGQMIYHAGDLNWWHWEGESDAYNAHMKTAYFKELENLKNISIDVAFVPVDPRLGEQYYYGIDALARCADVKALIPMHCWDDYTVCEKLMCQKETETYRNRIYPMTKEGEKLCLRIS